MHQHKKYRPEKFYKFSGGKTYLDPGSSNDYYMDGGTTKPLHISHFPERMEKMIEKKIKDCGLDLTSQTEKDKGIKPDRPEMVKRYIKWTLKNRNGTDGP